MTANPVRQAMLEGRLTLGTWIQIGHPAVAEILANAGFDWIAADMEHTDIDVAAFASLARGMHGRGAVPMARVRENDTLAIRQALDMGAQGVIVPLVHNAEDAGRAVAAAKYPPLGVRGYCFSRMNDWGEDFAAYAAAANEEIAVVVMIESRQGVENIDSILAVDGVDGVFIGPYDLSGSYGVPGETRHEQVLAGCQRVLGACKAAGKTAGLHVVIPDPAAVEQAVRDGYRFVGLGVDSVFLAGAARRALDPGRKLAGESSEA
jgi:2-keto-3-deoxy-L-rhamnonate aldolase RhmA